MAVAEAATQPRAAVKRVEVNAKDPYNFNMDEITTSAEAPLTGHLLRQKRRSSIFTISDPKFELTVTSSKPEATGTVTLKPGTYKFKCSFDTHAASGMTGEIVVS